MSNTPKLDHVGIAVASIDEAAGLYRALGLPIEATESVAEQGVRVAFLPAGDTRLELLEPTGPDSPIARFLDRKGPGIHHLSLQVDDIKTAMTELAAQGYELLSDEPQSGAHGSLVCFLHPRSAGGVLLELTQPAAATND
ncbi:MAG: methylmalonyl-CoA epimerase [bacterium]|nr:methylmalonyl-CoA epimerase [bacterium]